MRYGETIVNVHPASLLREGWVETILPDGVVVFAFPLHDDESKARAIALGYVDVGAMTLEHDPMHSLLCFALGLPESPSLRGAVEGRQRSTLGDAEEEMVLAAQRFLNLWRAQ